MLVVREFFFVVVLDLKEKFAVKFEFSQADLWDFGYHSLSYLGFGCEDGTSCVAHSCGLCEAVKLGALTNLSP